MLKIMVTKFHIIEEEDKYGKARIRAGMVTQNWKDQYELFISNTGSQLDDEQMGGQINGLATDTQMEQTFGVND